MTAQIGILVGSEWSWPPAFVEEVNRRKTGITAELLKLGGTRMDDLPSYTVIIDRISHDIPYYRTFLKAAAFAGVAVINNPFWSSADDKFIGAMIASRLGIAHPRTVALPSHSYAPRVKDEGLRNLVYPIPWEDHISYIGGFPAMLKPAIGGSQRRVFKLHSLQELWHAYDETGSECMLLQEHIAWDKYVRCICVGREHVAWIKYDVTAPWPHRYFRDDDYLTADEERHVIDSTLKLNQALGYDLNAVEFAIRDGVAYAIDFLNPTTELDMNALTPYYFDWVVKRMADYAIALAQGHVKQPVEPRWDALLSLGRSQS